MSEDRTKVFQSGNSQAVRLPKAYRFDALEVRIRKEGKAVILEPLESDWSWLDRVVGPLDEDFAAALEERVPEQDRPALDFFEE